MLEGELSQLQEYITALEEEATEAREETLACQRTIAEKVGGLLRSWLHSHINILPFSLLLSPNLPMETLPHCLFGVSDYLVHD